jgi:hypothetical protein
MNYIAGSDRTEALLLPEVLDDYIGPENPVRFIDAFAGQLDLSKAGFKNAQLQETGRRRMILEICCGLVSTVISTGCVPVAGWNGRRRATWN